MSIRAKRNAPPSPPEVQILNSRIQGRQHINTGESHPVYGSNPPTSGWHYDSKTMATIQRDTPVDEALVALLEQGYIWISYNPSTADQITIETLNNVPQEDPSLKIVVTARPQDDSPVAVAGWGKVMKLQQFTANSESEDQALHTFMRSLPLNAPDYHPAPNHG